MYTSLLYSIIQTTRVNRHHIEDHASDRSLHNMQCTVLCIQLANQQSLTGRCALRALASPTTPRCMCPDNHSLYYALLRPLHVPCRIVPTSRRCRITATSPILHPTVVPDRVTGSASMADRKVGQSPPRQEPPVNHAPVNLPPTSKLCDQRNMSRKALRDRVHTAYTAQ